MKAVVAPLEADRWTTKLCSECGNPRVMPNSWDRCSQCADGEKRRAVVQRAFHRVSIPGARRRRLWLGISQERVVRQSKLSRPTVSKVERGEPVKYSTAQAIAAALDTTVEELADA